MCEPLLTPDEAAKILQLHPKTVNRLATSGLIPGIKIGGRWRYRASSLDDWARNELKSCGHSIPSVEK